MLFLVTFYGLCLVLTLNPALIVRAGWAPDTQLAVEFIGFTWDPDSSSSSRTASQNTDTGLQKASP